MRPLSLAFWFVSAKALTLLRGGTFITYSHDTSDLEIINDGAMLFNDTILAISPTIDGLDDKGADEVVNTTGKIISPGFIDTHRHTWQTAMRTLGPDITLATYFWQFSSTGPPALILSPSDVHIASLMGSLEGLNAGVTTTVDYAHMTWSREHAESALQGVIDSGARVWWCYEVAPVVISDDPFTFNTSAPADQLAHITELAKTSPFNNGLVTLGIAYDAFAASDPTSKTIIETARNSSISLITAHYVGGAWRFGGHVISAVNDIPVTPPALNSSIAFIFAHGTSIDPIEMDLLRQTNQYISTTPESEMHYGHGHPFSYLIQDQASLGVDTHFTFSIDMITQMRIWLQSTRLPLYQEEIDKIKIPSDTPMKVKQVFLLGTRNGGLAIKRPDIGILAEGAKADILVFSTDAIGLVGWSDPVAAIVLHSNVRDIEEIYIDGKLVKTGGKLVVDWEGKGFAQSLRESAQKFRDALAQTNISAFQDVLSQTWPPGSLQPPFQVNVTRSV